MSGEAGAESREPKRITDSGLERFVESDENAGAAHVAAGAEDVFGFCQGVTWQDVAESEDDIAASGMGDDTGLRRHARREIGIVELFHRGGGEAGDTAVELIAEAAAGVHEANLFAVLRLVERAKAVRAPVGGGVFLFSAPECGARTVAEKTKAHQHTKIVVHVEGSAANLDSHDSNRGPGMSSQIMTGGAQRWNGGAAAESDEVMQHGIGFHVKHLSNMAGDAGA